jgi:gliding motility-associated-like protein
MINHIYKYCRNTFVFSFFIFLTTLVNAQNNALILNGGYAVLNGGTVSNPAYLVVNQPNTSGITRPGGGHINSENQYNYVKWVAGTNTGNYIFPFGVSGNAADYIPFTFNKTTAGVSDVQLSTWFTDVQNFPKPAATNVGAVTNMFGTADSTLFAIDRFWDIQATATADLTFSYRGVENTTINPTSVVRTQHWNGSAWDSPVGPGNLGVTTSIGTAGPFMGQNTFSPWVLITTTCTDTFTQNPIICQGDSFVVGTNVYTTSGTYIDTILGTGVGVVRDTFYFETFDGPITWTLNQSTGINGADNNFWVINDNEGGVAPSGCGVAGNGDNTLHITSVFNPSGGAAYDAGGLCGFLFCPQTNMAASSANISTIGKTNIALNFDFISNGEGLNDNASVLYSDNGGTTWNTINNSIKSPVCGSGQGQWTFSTSNLPANAENISNLRLRFNWTNNDNAIGGDPSVAINNVYLTYDSIISAACDSIITTNLTVNPNATSTDVQTACNSLTWIDGINYTVSTNTPTFTIVGGSTTGCDSVITLNLTINTFASGTDVQTACNSLTWIDGNTYSASTNTPTFTIVGGSVAGCDSVITLDLTINPTATSTDVQTACNSLTWIDGINYTASTNTPTFTIAGGSAAGCDSVVTLDLTINPTATSTDVQTACNSLTWIDGINYTASTNTPTFTIVGGSAVGCDSVVTLNLTINATSASTDVQTACNNYTWIDGNTYTANNNTATFTLTNSVGCDSVITLNLTINPPLSALPDAVTPICLGDPINLTATSSGNGIITWYSDASGATIIGTGSPCSPAPTVSATGTYTYYVNEAGTCSSALIPVDVEVNGVFAVIGATPSSGFMPLNVVFTNGSSTGVTYTWTFGDGSVTANEFAPNHTYTSLGNYLATLTVTDGTCSALASIVIEVKGESSILIPNVFTPNGDGKNDVFTVDGTNLESVEADIFNRWGLKMYSWNQVNGSWHGRSTSGSEAPDGTYFYIIKAKGLDGTEYFKKGAFSLIR